MTAGGDVRLQVRKSGPRQKAIWQSRGPLAEVAVTLFRKKNPVSGLRFVFV
jgi:hypothetical protein